MLIIKLIRLEISLLYKISLSFTHRFVIQGSVKIIFIFSVTKVNYKFLKKYKYLWNVIGNSFAMLNLTIDDHVPLQKKKRLNFLSNLLKTSTEYHV